MIDRKFDLSYKRSEQIKLEIDRNLKQGRGRRVNVEKGHFVQGHNTMTSAEMEPVVSESVSKNQPEVC